MDGEGKFNILVSPRVSNTQMITSSAMADNGETDYVVGVYRTPISLSEISVDHSFNHKTLKQIIADNSLIKTCENHDSCVKYFWMSYFLDTQVYGYLKEIYFPVCDMDMAPYLKKIISLSK